MKAKRAHPSKAQTPPKDRLFLSQTMKFTLKRVKTPLKSNKKRRLGTISCILFCVLIWCGRRDLNPYIEDTRPSNVRVCRFRHSRNGFSIIQHSFSFVNSFFEFFWIFLSFYLVLWDMVIWIKKTQCETIQIARCLCGDRWFLVMCSLCFSWLFPCEVI